MVNYPILSSFPTLTTLFPYLRFKAHLDCFDGFLTCVTEEQGVGHNDIIKDYDVIIMSELMIPSMILFPRHNL